MTSQQMLFVPAEMFYTEFIYKKKQRNKQIISAINISYSCGYMFVAMYILNLISVDVKSTGSYMFYAQICSVVSTVVHKGLNPGLLCFFNKTSCAASTFTSHIRSVFDCHALFLVWTSSFLLVLCRSHVSLFQNWNLSSLAFSARVSNLYPSWATFKK